MLSANAFRIIAKEKLKCELSQTCFNCAAMIGFHAKAGSDGVLSHTFTDEVLDLRIGGESAGEIEIIALWLWKYRIPVAFLSGRREAQEEAERIGCTFHANEVENDGIYTIEECLRRGTMLFERTLQDGSYDAGMIWGNNNFTKKVYVILRGEFYDDELSRCGYRIVSPATIEFESPSDFMCAAENFFSQVYLIRCRWLLSGIISERASIKLKERDREILLLSDDLLGKIKILISSLEDIRINRLSGSLYSQFELESKRVLQAAMERDWVQIKSSSVVSLVRCIGNITFVIAGYALILTKHISVAQFIQTASLAGQLMAVAITVASAPAAMEPQTVHIMRLYQVINGLCCKKKENTCASIKMRPDGIAGDEITLKYGERTIFKNASFRTKKHGITAVIGENGRGKTSLFRIITGEMQISSGKITFYEEENVLTIDEENRSQYISVAQQIPTIYRASVIENLRLSEEAKECSDKQIKNLCKKVGLYDDIIRLPMGFDTYLSPSIKLSAGQKSKLQIVRCILRNKPIIMMDEPFANLDVTSKKQVADVLKEYANENVVLIATHDSIGGEIATQIIDINDMENQGELKD